MSQQKNIELLIYRIVGDRRVPYHLELDSTMTVVADRPHIDLLKAQASTGQAVVTDQPTDLMAVVGDQIKLAQAANSSSEVESLINQVLQEGQIVKINDPNLVKKFPALAAVSKDAEETSVTHNYIDSGAAEDNQETVEELIRKATQEGHVIKTANAKLIEKYPGLTPAQREEMAASTQGEIEERQMPDGRVQKIYKPTPADITMGTWVTDIVEENPIPGTDELRAEYFAEVAELEARHQKRNCLPFV